MAEKIEPCPYCNGKCIRVGTHGCRVRCIACDYASRPMWPLPHDGTEAGMMASHSKTVSEAIAAHNKVSRNNAAADDLVAALMDLKSYSTTTESQLPTQRRGYVAAWGRAEAAIFKAKGETQ